MGSSKHKTLFVGLLASSLLAAGCLPNAVPVAVVGGTGQSTSVSTPPPSEGLIIRPDLLKLNINGTIYGMADMSADAVIKADTPDLSAGIDLGGTLSGFRVQQATGPRKLVENAAITLKGYDWKIIPMLPTKVSDGEGKFKFRSVPAKVAFFLDATYTLGGKTYRSFGLVRTKDGTEDTNVELDLASTLVSRYLLRLMQYAITPSTLNKPIDFKDLSAKEYTPLLADLRDLLAGGLPQGFQAIDMSKVNQPGGYWTLAKDKEDPAVVLLDRLTAYPQIEFDVQRLTDAIAREFNLKGSELRPPKAI